jgi:phosphoglycolate phosphatase-like HAD superfamily hydrolase
LWSLDIFLAALKLLKNPSTDRVIVVGDTPWDALGKKKNFCLIMIKNDLNYCWILAAIAAKLKVVGVLCGGFDEKLLRKSGCTWVYRDIIDLTKNYDQVTKDVLKI